MAAMASKTEKPLMASDEKKSDLKLVYAAGLLGSAEIKREESRKERIVAPTSVGSWLLVV